MFALGTRLGLNCGLLLVGKDKNKKQYCQVIQAFLDKSAILSGNLVPRTLCGCVLSFQQL